MKNHTLNIVTQLNSYCHRNHKKHYNHSINNNIFNQQELILVDKSDLSSLITKQYQIVGWKQLKQYQGKCRKSKKNTIRKATASKQDRSSSKESRRKKDHLMNKQQVFQTLPVINNLSESSLQKGKGDFWMTQMPNQDLSNYRFSSMAEDTENGNQFSVRKLKVSLNQRNTEWDKLLLKVKRDNPIFPSVFKRVETYRSKVQDRQRGEILSSLPLNSSKKWPSVLRREVKLQDMTQRRQIPRTFHGGNDFLAKGSSKLRTEGEWLEHKQDSGYNFKLLKNCSELSSKPISRR